jgi:hypothetical protein
LPIQVTERGTAITARWEARIVMTQNRERQRNRKPIKIWDTISQFHPYKNEILNAVKILNSIGANCKIIAATLDLQNNCCHAGFTRMEDLLRRH